jgi:hypothetical protein
MERNSLLKRLVFSKTDKLWKYQCKLIRLMRGGTVNDNKLTEFYQKNKGNFPQPEDLKWLMQFQGGKCYCGKYASFNWPRFDWKLRCKKHKEPGMIDVKSARCEIATCNNIAHYGDLKKTRCREQSKEMLALKKAKCTEWGCNNRAMWKFSEGSEKYCDDHGKDGMVTILDVQCRGQDCRRNAKWGMERNSHCFGCKTDKMILLHEYGFCKWKGCTNKSKPTTKFCKQHTMVKRPECVVAECKNYPFYGYLDGSMNHCWLHHKDGMITIQERRKRRIAQFVEKRKRRKMSK